MNIFKRPQAGAALLAMAGALLVVTPDAKAALLTLTGPIAGNTIGPQSSSNPCIIAGTQCQQPAGFGFNNFDQNGHTDSYDLYSTTPTAQIADGVQGTPYTVAQINGVTNSQPFAVAIDVNTAQGGETLQLFQVIVNGSVFDSYTGPTLIGNISNNGNGFADFTLGTIDLSSFAPNATVLFHAVFDGTSDGAESFFIVGAAPTQRVPEPGTLATFGTMLIVLGGISYAMRRRREFDL